VLRRSTLRDVPAILDVTRTSAGEPEWSVDEVVATLTTPNHESWLAIEPDGTPAAWAFLHNPTRGPDESVAVYAKSEATRRALLELAVARAGERAHEAGHAAVTLRAGVNAAEPSSVAALRSAGFAFVKRHARMRRALGPADRLAAVPGIRVFRPDHESELRRFHLVLDEALAGTVDFVSWRAAPPTVSWDEWFVAEVHGEIVGVLQSSDEAVWGDEGWVKNLAVLGPFRRRGIGRALLTAAFATYAAKGRRWAGLGVDVANPTGAYRLYTSVGMVPVFAAEVYERRILGGAARGAKPLDRRPTPAG
jgi:mycothiol synthase